MPVFGVVAVLTACLTITLQHKNYTHRYHVR